MMYLPPEFIPSSWFYFALFLSPSCLLSHSLAFECNSVLHLPLKITFCHLLASHGKYSSEHFSLLFRRLLTLFFTVLFLIPRALHQPKHHGYDFSHSSFCLDYLPKHPQSYVHLLFNFSGLLAFFDLKTFPGVANFFRLVLTLFLEDPSRLAIFQWVSYLFKQRKVLYLLLNST